MGVGCIVSQYLDNWLQADTRQITDSSRRPADGVFAHLYDVEYTATGEIEHAATGRVRRTSYVQGRRAIVVMVSGRM